MGTRVFHGIGIDEDGSIFCGDGEEEISECWEGIAEIIDYIVKNSPQDISQKESYEEAVLAVERFKSWNKNINLSKKNHISDTVLNEILKPAVEYVKKLECKI